MSRPMTRIYQGNGEFIDREMNDEEYAQFQIDQKDYLDRKAAEQAEAEAKAAAKAALLEQLGITEEQARLLLS